MAGGRKRKKAVVAVSVTPVDQKLTETAKKRKKISLSAQLKNIDARLKSSLENITGKYGQDMTFMISTEGLSWRLGLMNSNTFERAIKTLETMASVTTKIACASGARCKSRAAGSMGSSGKITPFFHLLSLQPLCSACVAPRYWNADSKYVLCFANRAKENYGMTERQLRVAGCASFATQRLHLFGSAGKHVRVYLEQQVKRAYAEKQARADNKATKKTTDKLIKAYFTGSSAPTATPPASSAKPSQEEKLVALRRQQERKAPISDLHPAFALIVPRGGSKRYRKYSPVHVAEDFKESMMGGGEGSIVEDQDPDGGQAVTADSQKKKEPVVAKSHEAGVAILHSFYSDSGLSKCPDCGVNTSCSRSRYLRLSAVKLQAGTACGCDPSGCTPKHAFVDARKRRKSRGKKPVDDRENTDAYYNGPHRVRFPATKKKKKKKKKKSRGYASLREVKFGLFLFNCVCSTTLFARTQLLLEMRNRAKSALGEKCAIEGCDRLALPNHVGPPFKDFDKCLKHTS